MLLPAVKISDIHIMSNLTKYTSWLSGLLLDYLVVMPLMPGRARCYRDFTLQLLDKQRAVAWESLQLEMSRTETKRVMLTVNVKISIYLSADRLSDFFSDKFC